MVQRDRIFQPVAHFVLAAVVLFCVLPFFLLFGASLTNETAIIHEGYSIIPAQFDLAAYRYVLQGVGSILRSYGMSVIVMLIGTALNLTITILFAYPLSRKDLPGRGFFSFLLFFTLLFSGGLLPAYIMWTQTFQIQNSIYALIVPNLLMNGFFVIMARSYLAANIPTALIEAAKIDGASEIKVLTSIILPLSKPIVATIGLFVSFSYWNDWLNGLYYVRDENLYTIQVLLNRMLMDTMYLKSSLSSSMSLTVGQTVPTETIKMAVAVLGVLPLLIIYPFVTRYLRSGIVIGAVKE